MESCTTMTIESPKTTVPKPAPDVFSLLSDVRNFRKLMPDNVEEFEVLNEDTFMFALKGMPQISLRLKEKYPPESIIYEAAEGKVPFTLTLYIDEKAAAESGVRFVFQGEFNAMMAMMIKSPISNFIRVLSKNTVKL